ncbi:MAG: shikimate kinase [Actinobacteria bacterium]|nr:shikimate kinase [Actinomycetota bacterium]
MGSGKSEVARILSSSLERPLADTDEMVERANSRSVSQIFHEIGEPAFRGLESRALREALSDPTAVIAAGGGIVLDPLNADLVKKKARVFYLKVTPETAALRIGNGNGRPLVEGKEVVEEIARIIADREAIYDRAAHHVIDAEREPAAVAESIEQLLQ